MKNEIPPYDPKLEAAVLGGILLAPFLIDEVVENLGKNPEEAFFQEATRTIFVAMLELSKKGEEINPYTLIDELKRKGKLERVGGEDFILSLPQYIPSSTHLISYSKKLYEKRVLRDIYMKSKKIMEEISWGVENVWEFVGRIEKDILETTKNVVPSDFFEFHNIKKEAQKILQEETRIIKTGIENLDKVIGGFNPGDFALIAGRPGMGKTSFVLTLAYNMAHQGIPIGIFSLEMSTEILIMRFLAAESRIDLQKIIRKEYGWEERQKLLYAAEKLSSLPIYINDSAAGITSIKTLSKKLKVEKNVGAIIIDYIQQSYTEWKIERKVDEISTISRMLKFIAKELDIPIIAVSQLSREPEKRQGRRPQLSDLRESGSLEQDADIVLMLYREGYYNPCTCPPDNFCSCGRRYTTEIIIAKNRNGPTGIVEISFKGNICYFE